MPKVKWRSVEKAKAKKWKPKMGSTLQAMLQAFTTSEYGKGYLVKELKTEEMFFLPKHKTLTDLLNVSGIKEGGLLRLKCIKEGSRKRGDYYDYELQVAKGNAPF